MNNLLFSVIILSIIVLTEYLCYPIEHMKKKEQSEPPELANSIGLSPAKITNITDCDICWDTNINKCKECKNCKIYKKDKKDYCIPKKFSPNNRSEKTFSECKMNEGRDCISDEDCRWYIDNKYNSICIPKTWKTPQSK